MDSEDLTASHWDDVLLSSHNPFSSSSAYNSAPAPLSNEFADLNINQPKSDHESETENEDESNNQYDNYDPIEEARQSHLQDVRTERKQNLLSELTQGEESILEESIVTSPKKVNNTDSLFNERDSPIKINDTAVSPAEITSPTRSSQLKNGKFRAPRPRKYPAKTVVKHLNGSPLGPLGTSNELDSEKFDSGANSKADQLVQEVNAPLYNIAVSEESRIDNLAKSAPEKQQKVDKKLDTSEYNKLEMSVGDPMKVGDITNAHIVYSIKTKSKNENSKYWPAQLPETSVTRRYKDFRWIYHQLQNNHPGKIIPPPPSKQTFIGRFKDSFIENRRLSLEKMLSKIGSIPVLCNDADFVMFLTSEDFTNESKERERLSGSGASTQNNDSLDKDHTEIGDAPIVAGTAAASGGFMSSFFSISTKVDEPDEYFTKKQVYIDDLEYNLKNFYKSIELISTQRVDMMGLLEEISFAMEELGNYEILKVTTDLLHAFSEVQMKLKENLDRINLQDHLTLGFTIEEYLRIIGSIKFVFDTRLKIYQQFLTFKQDLAKKRSLLEKYNKKFNSGATSQEKINQLNFEIDKLTQKTDIYEKKFTNVSDTIKEELENFEMERIDDFRNSVEIFIESSIESQKEAIELWETFYERQNLANV